MFTVCSSILIFIFICLVHPSLALDQLNKRILSINPMKKSAATTARYLETNTYVFKLGDVKIFSDPVMGQLDFGIPMFYSGNKRFINADTALKEEAASCDVVLISQGLDDHCHSPTVKKLTQLRPDMPYICAPSAVPVLTSCGVSESKITVLNHGMKLQVQKGNTKVEILATEGALVGPPWQLPENGYILRPAQDSGVTFPSIYYEPHCMYNEEELKGAGPVDYVIAPVVAQKLPLFTLVDGGNKALVLAQLLRAKAVIPMMNGELEQAGVLSWIVRKEGTVEAFMKSAARSKPMIKVLYQKPGVELTLTK